MAFHVYILRCADGSFYTGHTDDLEKRIAMHNQGVLPGYTSNRRPVTLVFSDEFATRETAFERDRQIKGWSRAKKEALIDENWDELIRLSKSRANRSSTHPSTSSG